MTYTEEQLDEIDRLVAQHIFGWQFKPCSFGLEDWHPTRDRGHAMLVFEECPWMTLMPAEDDWWKTRFGAYQAGEMGDYWEDGLRTETHARADTPMLAICLSSLAKAGVEVPE